MLPTLALLGFFATQPLSGTFTRGVWSISFGDDGRFRIVEGSAELSAGRYRVSEGRFTLIAETVPFSLPLFGERISCESSADGVYRYSLEGGRLSFEALSDDCAIRRQVFHESVWNGAASPSSALAAELRSRSRDLEANRPDPGELARSWPSFRGHVAGGVASDQSLPDRWNGVTGENVRWKVQIPGLAHSSPIVWGDRLFLTTAVSSRGIATFRPGLYGDGDASEDRSPQKWIVYAFDKKTGEVLWERIAHEGIPRDKRHVKSTYASSTPATDGRLVVAWFGSQGVYAYDLDGRLRWKADVGRLDLGAYDVPAYEWGPASSPILWNGLVLLQCDTQHESFLLALDAANGDVVWKTDRNELPSWATPTVYEGPTGVELITNAPNLIRGYDPSTGEELWRLGGSSKITAPTPVFTPDRIVVASGRGPERPIFVLKPGARGDRSLPEGASRSETVVWSLRGRGPYMPTPLVYEGILYILGNNGIWDAYELDTGKEIYRQRIPHLGSGFSASPVATDGKIYLSNEDGEISVVRAGREFAAIATNPMGEPLMATPALSERTMYVRSQSHLFAVGAVGAVGKDEPE